MNRRRYLDAVLGGALVGLSGCLAETEPGGAGDSSPGSGPGAGGGTVVGADGSPSDICERKPRTEYIPAIVEPAFGASWDDIGPSLEDTTTVVGIERDGEARAYPLPVLQHEIVNDDFDIPVLVTYCPLCASGLTASRVVAGEGTVFENTSYTWLPPGGPAEAALDADRVFGLSGRGEPGEVEAFADRNLVMVDRRTGSYWSQLLGQAICGPLTGERLGLVPSTVSAWGPWRDRHPDTSVLLPPPHSTTV